MKINNGYPCNPYLPGKEYVPDGEPRVFGDRIYVYGSHDEFGASGYCTGCYVGWSASAVNPGEWTYEGVILEKGQDPLDPEGNRSYYAPDVVRGSDGRFYMYYSIEDSYVISVAVCDEPVGKYQFLGHVKDHAGHVLGSAVGDAYQFDPAVLIDDDGRIYLYSGQGMPTEEIGGRRVLGSQVCELETDMVTVKTEQRVITSRQENCFESNPFFEASSIRKFEGKYYFIYSPIPNVHNLCYAISDQPDCGFTYQGVLVSNGDLFLEQNNIPRNYWGNNHGSILKLGEEYYVFYHRHTNKSGWNRQGCIEHLQHLADGTFRQAAITSLGFQEEAFPAEGEYGAYITCGLHKKDMEPFQPFQFYQFTEEDPYLTEEKETPYQFIANMRDGSKACFRYLRFTGEEKSIYVRYRGQGTGAICITDADHKQLSRICVENNSLEKDWQKGTASLEVTKGVCELVLTYQGKGAVDLLSFGFGEERVEE